MDKNVIYIEFFNADKSEYEWREFSTSEIDDLMKLEIIDDDTLGYAMKDMDSFEKAFSEFEESGKEFTYKELVERYIEISGKEVRIER